MYEIYKITNDVNNLVYIGYTSMGLKERFRHHVKYKKSAISKAIQAIGKEHFSICGIDTAGNKQEAMAKEKEYTLQYQSNNPEYGYNVCAGASYYGRPISEDTKEKISTTQKGKPRLSGENHPMYGKHLSETTRQKISESLKGRYVGDKNPSYGKKHSPETLAKISGENHWTARKSFTAETRAKMSEAHKGEKSSNHRACRCIETGETFPYVRAAAIKYGISECHIHDVCKGKRTRCGKMRWEYISDSEVIHTIPQ